MIRLVFHDGAFPPVLMMIGDAEDVAFYVVKRVTVYCAFINEGYTNDLSIYHDTNHWYTIWLLFSRIVISSNGNVGVWKVFQCVGMLPLGAS